MHVTFWGHSRVPSRRRAPCRSLLIGPHVMGFPDASMGSSPSPDFSPSPDSSLPVGLPNAHPPSPPSPYANHRNPSPYPASSSTHTDPNPYPASHDRTPGDRHLVLSAISRRCSVVVVLAENERRVRGRRSSEVLGSTWIPGLDIASLPVLLMSAYIILGGDTDPCIRPRQKLSLAVGLPRVAGAAPRASPAAPLRVAHSPPAPT